MIIEATDKITISEATHQDIDSFEYNGIEREVLSAVDIQGKLNVYRQVGNMYAVKEIDGEVIAMYGDYECSPGVLQVWMLFNHEAGRYAKTIIKEMKIQLAQRMQTYHRIQTYLFVGDKGARYIEILGFKKEGTMKAFGPNKEDAEIWAMVVQ